MEKIKRTVSPRWARFCGWCLRKLGWKSDNGPMEEKKAIVLGVPHTTVWDFLICYLFYTQFGKVAHIMIKKEFFFWPLGPILRACGAVPVDRKNATAMLKSIIDAMDSEEEFHLAIAPEGTRKAVKRWKTGYYTIAKATGAQVYVGYYDWGRKRIGVGEKWILLDDPKTDIRAIQDHYAPMGLQGRNKNGFTTG